MRDKVDDKRCCVLENDEAAEKRLGFLLQLVEVSVEEMLVNWEQKVLN